jgi:hypothetical protein
MYSIVLGARLRSYSFIFSNIILFSFIRVYDLTFTFFLKKTILLTFRYV